MPNLPEPPPLTRKELGIAETTSPAPLTEADLGATIEMLGDRVEYWQAKYEALRSQVTDVDAVRASESVVSAAANIARNQHIPFREAFTAMMEHLYGSRAIRRSGKTGKRHERRLHKL